MELQNFGCDVYYLDSNDFDYVDAVRHVSVKLVFHDYIPDELVVKVHIITVKVVIKDDVWAKD